MTDRQLARHVVTGGRERGPTVNAADPDPPLVYLVCATPRVGSSHFCSALGGVPGAGDPTEWFGRAMLYMRAGEWGLRAAGSTPAHSRLSSAASYLDRVRAFATTNGALAFKVHWNQVERCRDELGMDVLGVFAGRDDVRYLHIWREDLVAQTVSSHIAAATKIYHRYRGQPNVPIDEFAGMAGSEPEYDFERLVALLLELATFEAAWDTYFAESSSRPHRISYAQLESDLLGSVNGALAHLGLPPTTAVESAMVRQRTELNTEFAARFRADLAERELLDLLPESVRHRCEPAASGS